MVFVEDGHYLRGDYRSLGGCLRSIIGIGPQLLAVELRSSWTVTIAYLLYVLCI